MLGIGSFCRDSMVAEGLCEEDQPLFHLLKSRMAEISIDIEQMFCYNKA